MADELSNFDNHLLIDLARPITISGIIVDVQIQQMAARIFLYSKHQA